MLRLLRYRSAAALSDNSRGAGPAKGTKLLLTDGRRRRHHGTTHTGAQRQPLTCTRRRSTQSLPRARTP